MILLEAKIDDVALQYPEISELLLQYLQDVKPKYLVWSAKMLSQTPTDDTAEFIVKLVLAFDTLSNKNQIKQTFSSYRKTIMTKQTDNTFG